MTPNWAAYLESRRALEKTRADIEQFAEAMKELGEDEKPQAPERGSL
jgi:hypothetical protein